MLRDTRPAAGLYAMIGGSFSARGVVLVFFMVCLPALYPWALGRFISPVPYGLRPLYNMRALFAIYDITKNIDTLLYIMHK